MKNIRYSFIVLIFIFTGCAKEAQPVLPTLTAMPPTATIFLPTETPTEIPSTPTLPVPTADPTVFGSIGQSEIQAFALESVANAIFTKTFDGFVADGRIKEYRVMRVTVFPGGGGLLSEITFNIRTSDSSWLESDGTQAADNWINGKCYRFDFFTTETEFQLKNRRLCN